MAETEPATATLVVSWIGASLGLLVFALRIVNNSVFVRRFRADFHLVALTVVCFSPPPPRPPGQVPGRGPESVDLDPSSNPEQAIQLTAQIVLQIAIQTGIGKHTSTLSHDAVSRALKWSAVFQILVVASSVTGKLAIMAFLVQLRGLHERRPWFFWTLGLLLIVVNVVDFATMLGQCRPMSKIWDAQVPGTCEPGRKANEIYSYFQAGAFSLSLSLSVCVSNGHVGFNAVSDAVLAAYPVLLLWKLQMALRVKIGLWVLMGLGWMYASSSSCCMRHAWNTDCPAQRCHLRSYKNISASSFNQSGRLDL